MTTRFQPSSLRRRRNRIIRFFARAILEAFVWDVLIRSLGGRQLARRTAMARYVALARRFRVLAVDMGGVLIKLGQFVSSRADLLPNEITGELAGLQDEVPAAPFEPIRAVIETELGTPLNETFSSFHTQPIAAASLGQVYHAALRTGQRVVVKVQRPGIETLIAIDLDAIGWVVGWLKRLAAIRRRANLDALLEEFSATLYDEIDYLAEGRNAEHFAAEFAGWPRIRIPSIHWTHTTRRVLTMQDVGAVKIDDVPAYQAQGVDRKDVARTLFEFYLEQIFGNGFFHADPHPGNLFVEPRGEGRFTLNVVDFGMVGRITPDLRAHLREGFIGVALRDPHRLVQSMLGAGWLLPSADVTEIERAVDKVFAEYWGITMGELRNLDLNEARRWVSEFRQLLYQMPFQFPSNVLFLARAMGILSGLATTIDPEFNVFDAAEPFARSMLVEDGETALDAFVARVVEIGAAVTRLPTQMERLIGATLRGDVRVNLAGSDALMREMRALNASLRRLINTLIFAAFLLAGVLLQINGYPQAGAWAIGLAVLVLAWSLLRR